MSGKSDERTVGSIMAEADGERFRRLREAIASMPPVTRCSLGPLHVEARRLASKVERVKATIDALGQDGDAAILRCRSEAVSTRASFEQCLDAALDRAYRVDLWQPLVVDPGAVARNFELATAAELRERKP